MAHLARLAASALFGAILLVSGMAQAADAPKGLYCGKLDLNGRMVDTVTSFTTDPGQNRLSGTYRFRDGGKIEDGKLVEPSAGGRTRRLVWTDRYGSGSLVIKFSSDYSAFSGAYGMNKNQPRFRWTGARCVDPNVTFLPQSVPQTG